MRCGSPLHFQEKDIVLNKKIRDEANVETTDKRSFVDLHAGCMQEGYVRS